MTILIDHVNVRTGIGSCPRVTKSPISNSTHRSLAITHRAYVARSSVHRNYLKSLRAVRMALTVQLCKCTNNVRNHNLCEGAQEGWMCRHCGTHNTWEYAACRKCGAWIRPSGFESHPCVCRAGRRPGRGIVGLTVPTSADPLSTPGHARLVSSTFRRCCSRSSQAARSRARDLSSSRTGVSL